MRRILIPLALVIALAFAATTIAPATSADTADSGSDSASAEPISVPAPISDEILPPPPEPNLAPEGMSIQSHHGCANHTACMWHYAHFDGKKHYAYPWMGGTGWRNDYPGYSFNSAKNRFGNRKFETGNYFNVTSCINPGGNRENLAYSDRYHVGNAGSRC